MSDNFNITFTFTGIAELERELKKLDDKIARKYNRRAVMNGARVLRDKVKSLCPVGTVEHWIGLKKYGIKAKPGNLKKSIDVKELRVKDPRSAVAIVGPRAGRGQTYDGFYGKWVERGTVKMAARPFLQPALIQSFDAIMEKYAQVLTEALYG
jgi:HK97 gp10 family phage protein